MKQYNIPDISNEEAHRIINEIDVAAFLRYIPFEMREDYARRRLEFYRDVELKHNYNSAKFYLDRNVYFGASDAAVMAALYADSANVNLQKETGMELYFANIYEFMKTRIGRIDPQRPTNYTIQGHRMEPIIEQALVEDHGFTPRPDLCEKVSNYIHPSRPLNRVTPDQMMQGPDGVLYTVDYKAVQGTNFEEEKDMHYFQSQAQIRQTIDSGVASEFEYGGGIMAYYDWTKAGVTPIIINSDVDIQEMIIRGYETAIEYTESQTIPVYVPEKPSGELKESDRVKTQKLIHAAATLKKAQKVLKNRENEISSIVKETLLESGVAPGTLKRADVIENAPFPAPSVRVKDQYNLDAKKVKEEADKRGIVENHTSVSETSVADVAGLLEKAKEAKIDVSPFMSEAFDVESAAKELHDEYRLDESLLRTREFGVSNIDTSNSKNEEAKEYSTQLLKGVVDNVGEFEERIMNANELDFADSQDRNKQEGLEKNEPSIEELSQQIKEQMDFLSEQFSKPETEQTAKNITEKKPASVPTFEQLEEQEGNQMMP